MKKLISKVNSFLSKLSAKNLTLLELFPKERTIRDAHYFAQISAALNFDHFLLKYKSSNINQDLRIDQKLLAKIGKTLSLKML